ncbi:acetyltransferase [Phenylobacterium sp. Root77]|jgi:putative acetyltransferase|uniref:acetyltransferase n=1 Tax=unclassified Phenylobacterium TaxID=2640670 RepID=UPI0006FA2EE7|nr:MULTISPECIES: acetyltransferase [unclassified Phenylobacterium]KQW67066.1 acetyltransferase [Phenylobacterium sp. Root1277]KQW89759.1 acetyltransferase [Phenylobacterium sp. Root1290]KRC43552.1 acetyltransferase [Phenylobacterium sp. Root77]
MIELRPSSPQDAERVLQIWREAVAATHGFLKPADRDDLEALVRDVVSQAPLTLAVDQGGRPLAFMLLDGAHMEALFVDPLHSGAGLGRRLVEHALAAHDVITTDVNEQNHQAMRFYLRMGFSAFGRSETDGQGRAYPLIHLRRGSSALSAQYCNPLWSGDATRP